MAGSLTSFLFEDLSCTCQSGGDGDRAGAGRQSGERAALNAKTKDKLCQRCGKIIPEIDRVGSLTSFFFKDLRCQCSTFQKDNGLSTRFSGHKNIAVSRQRKHATFMAMTRSALARETEAFVELAPGQVIGGTYQLLAQAGQGGMGTVFRARHNVLRRECAIKFLAPSMVSQETWQMFQKEAKIISSLTHETICQIYDLGIHRAPGAQSGGLPYYAMDFVEGFTLDELLTSEGPLSVGAAAELYLKITEGLAYAHRRGVVHKDLKPGNIMIEPRNDGDVQIRILDFGISELNESGSSRGGVRRPGQTAASSLPVMGSAAYMSPEQFEGRAVEKVSDIYSLGCSMFETLTGQTPFEGESFEHLAELHANKRAPLLSERTGQTFPVVIEALVQKCLEKNPSKRYQSAAELGIDLQKILEDKDLQFVDVQSFAKERGLVVAEPNGGSKKIFVGIAASIVLTGAAAATLYLSGAAQRSPANVKIKDMQKDAPNVVSGVNVDQSDAAGLSHLIEMGQTKLDVEDKYKTSFQVFNKQFSKETFRSAKLEEVPDPKPGEIFIFVPATEADFWKYFPKVKARVPLGVDLLYLRDSKRLLQRIAVDAPKVQFLRLFSTTKTDFADVAKMRSLVRLEVHGNFNDFSTIYIPPSVTSLNLCRCNPAGFKVDRPAANYIEMQNCKVSKGLMQSIAKNFPGSILIFRTCTFETGAFLGLLDSDKQFKVSIFHTPKETPVSLVGSDTVLRLQDKAKFKFVLEEPDHLDAIEGSLPR